MPPLVQVPDRLSAITDKGTVPRFVQHIKARGAARGAWPPPENERSIGQPGLPAHRGLHAVRTESRNGTICGDQVGTVLLWLVVGIHAVTDSGSAGQRTGWFARCAEGFAHIVESRRRQRNVGGLPTR